MIKLIKLVFNFLLFIGGAFLSTWSVVMWARINFKFFYLYSDVNTDGIFFFFAFIFGIIATTYSMAMISRQLKIRTKRTPKIHHSKKKTITTHESKVQHAFFNFNVRRGMRDFLFLLAFLSIGLSWMIDYLNRGYVRVKNGWPVYGWQAKLCIFSVIVLPLFAYCWVIIKQLKEKTSSNQEDTPDQKTVR